MWEFCKKRKLECSLMAISIAIAVASLTIQVLFCMDILEMSFENIRSVEKFVGLGLASIVLTVTVIIVRANQRGSV